MFLNAMIDILVGPALMKSEPPGCRSQHRAALTTTQPCMRGVRHG